MDEPQAEFGELERRAADRDVAWRLERMLVWRKRTFLAALAPLAILAVAMELGGALMERFFLVFVGLWAMTVGFNIWMTLLYIYEAVEREAGRWYALRTVCMAGVLTPLLGLGIMIVPLLVKTELAKLHGAEKRGQEGGDR